MCVGEFDLMEYPKLRRIDAFPFETSGQKVIALRDPTRLDDKVLVVYYPVFFVVSLFDGTRSLNEIKAEYMRRYGEILYTERLDEIISYLDDQYLLESERYAQYHQKLEEEFRLAQKRESVFAGKSYESDPDKLNHQIEQFFTGPGGPGAPSQELPGDMVKGLIAPHIDFQRGGPCYAWAYKELAESVQPDLFILLGTVHSPTTFPFVLTSKTFATPWGEVKTDGEIVSALAEKLSFDPFHDELVHKTEHTIEFQTVFLDYLYRDRKKLKILPVLCSSFHDIMEQGTTPQDKPYVNEFIETLRSLIEGTSYRSCCIASADLAHVGLRFGDSVAPSNASLKEIERKDIEMLSHVERLNADAFYESIAREKDARKICGLPPIYTLLKLIDSQEGSILNYQQSVEAEAGSVVTFTSMVFT
jgi:AmmeMemoRadiSam system protein B